MEFDRVREDSVCCGGGGGRLWMETPVDERFAVVKLREAMEKGAEAVVTACPYCVSMFEDARTALNAEKVRVAEVTEIVAEAI
jgi:Fe-S oxidoreductase